MHHPRQNHVVHVATPTAQDALVLDALDPAHAPGTEIASAGGLTTRQALELLEAVAASSTLVGLDVVEVAPSLDHADVTVLAFRDLVT